MNTPRQQDEHRAVDLVYGQDAPQHRKASSGSSVPCWGLKTICTGCSLQVQREGRLAEVRIRSRIRSQGPRPHMQRTKGSFLDESQGFPRGLNQQDVVSACPTGGSPDSPPSHHSLIHSLHRPHSLPAWSWSGQEGSALMGVVPSNPRSPREIESTRAPQNLLEFSWLQFAV